MSNEGRRGLCLVVSAPSGAGKSSILRALLAEEPGIALSVSVTTRAPRPGERDGVDYHFTDRDGFDRMVADNALLEHATVFGRSYGTPRAHVVAALEAGRDVAFDIDWQGHRQLQAALPEDVVSVFVLPPSLDALRARLEARAGDSEGEIGRRMAAARAELAHWPEFDHVLMNEVLEDAVATVRCVLRAARSARHRQTGLAAVAAAMLDVEAGTGQGPIAEGAA